VTAIREAAIDAGSAPIRRRFPSLGDDAAANLAGEVLEAAQPHLVARESQDEAHEALLKGLALAGLTPWQRGEVEGLCARLIEAAARPDYRSWVPVQRAPKENAG
jgi:hypothetical protein